MAQEEKQNSPSQHSLQGDSIYRIPLYYYLHVLDQTSNVIRVEVGPKTFIRLENERVILGPQKMVVIPPRHYCIIENPVIREDGSIKYDPAGQAKLRHADLEVRLEQVPFPLYPREILRQDITPLVVVKKNSAVHPRAERDFRGEDGVERVAGDEWLFEGPGTYIPLKVLVAGENWLVKQLGAYLPGANEEIADLLDAYLFTDKDCQAGLNFADESEAQSFRNVAYFVLYNLNDNKESDPPERSQSVPHLPESSSNKNRNRRGNRRVTKADIGLPTDFRHVQHIGWNPTSGSEINVDDDLMAFLKVAGVSETQLRDKDTRQFIYDFLQKHGGIDAAVREIKAFQPPGIE